MTSTSCFLKDQFFADSLCPHFEKIITCLTSRLLHVPDNAAQVLNYIGPADLKFFHIRGMQNLS